MGGCAPEEGKDEHLFIVKYKKQNILVVGILARGEEYHEYSRGQCVGKNFVVMLSKLLQGKGKIPHKPNANAGRRGSDLTLALLSDL